MENNNELSPPQEIETNDYQEPSAPEKPKKQITSADELFERLEAEDPDTAEALTEATRGESGGESFGQSAKDKEYISKVTQNIAQVRELTNRVQSLEYAKNEFASACKQIEELYQTNQISQEQYAQAVQNARFMDVQIREEQLNVTAHHDNLQKHYAGMLTSLQKEFPEEWSPKVAQTTNTRILNMAEKMGLDKSVVIEGMEIPGVAQFFTRTLRMEQELAKLKGEALRRSKPAPMQAKIASLADSAAKRQETHNKNVGYFGSRESTNAQLDKISALLSQNSR